MHILFCLFKFIPAVLAIQEYESAEEMWTSLEFNYLKLFEYTLKAD